MAIAAPLTSERKYDALQDMHGTATPWTHTAPCLRRQFARDQVLSHVARGSVLIVQVRRAKVQHANRFEMAISDWPAKPARNQVGGGAVHKQASRQLELKPRTWGGAREGAGRPKAARRASEPHRARPALARRYPVHVVQRVVPALVGLRRRDGYAAIAVALRRVLGAADFRIVHVSIQRTHLHLLVEADDQRALARGMHRFTIAAARALNEVAHRRGKVFPQRYHATIITSPRQTRSALAYVLNNWRKHRENEGRAALDQYASGVVFDGWSEGPYAVPAGYEVLPVRNAQTWLMTVGWRMHGLIDARETPGRRWDGGPG